MYDCAPILKSPDEHRVIIKTVARCRTCKLEHREFNLTPEQWRHAVFDWLWKHQGHDCYFVSPERTIPGRFRDWMFEKCGVADWWLAYGSNANLLPVLGAVTTITLSLAPGGVGLASSSTWAAGRQSTAVAGAGMIDAKVTGKVTTGTSPVAATEIRLSAIGTLDDAPTWPDTFGSTDAAVTVTNSNMVDQLPLLQSTTVASTNNIAYPLFKTNTIVGALGYMPNNWSIFVAHNTGVALNATGSNHVFKYQGWYFNSLN